MSSMEGRIRRGNYCSPYVVPGVRNEGCLKGGKSGNIHSGGGSDGEITRRIV